LRNQSIDRRTILLIAGFGLLFTILTMRLFYLQIIQHQHLSQLALRQQERTIEIQPARGRIFDRQGRPLALNRQSISFYAVPGEIKKTKQIARQLSVLLGVSARRLEQRFRSRKAFVWIKRKVPDEVAHKVQALNLAGVHHLQETSRVYPEGRLACHVLGFVGMDNQGLSGVELQFDRVIRGQSGWIRITRDAKGRRLPTATRIHKQSQPGQDVYLTIDKVIQHIAERELARGMEQSKAKAGSVIVMNPCTGEILALANKPDFDPNHFNRASAVARRNRAICDVYEPGSTFKIITAAAALEEGVFQEDDIIDCENGRAVFNGLVVRDHEPRGKISFREVVVFSSNIGAVKIGIRLGADKLAHYVRMFGFGKATGIEMPGEAIGILKSFSQWKRWTAASIPFGQGLAVTTLQMVTAYATIANDGRLVKPWIIKELRRPDEVRTKIGRPVFREQVISARTAERMRKILRAVVQAGTGVKASLKHYQVAGKTGTAQKSLPGGRGYDPIYHVASFIGFFPADKPKYLIAVVIDEPKGVQWGGVVAGPVFRKICRQMVAYLGIPPGPQKVYAFAQDENKNRLESITGAIHVPQVTGMNLSEAKTVLKKLGLRIVCLGKGKQVIGQRPFARQWINPESRVVLYLADPEYGGVSETILDEVVVPNLGGQTLRDALHLLSVYGLRADVSGSGVVEIQDPQPYARIKVGEHCMIQCQDPEAGL